MRITTWNCHHGALDERCTLLGTLVPDICILQECYRPSVFDDRQLWLGAPESPNAKGIGIKVSGRHQIHAASLVAEVGNSTLPFTIRPTTGPTLHVLAICAEQSPSYVKYIDRALAAYGEFLKVKNAILVGDLNSSPVFDGSGSNRPHSQLVNRLSEEFGLVSAYHCVHTDQPELPTYYHNRKQDKPFHIDYCFIPRDWAKDIRGVTVGGFHDWIAESDHMPVTVDIDRQWSTLDSK